MWHSSIFSSDANILPPANKLEAEKNYEHLGKTENL